jgi:hypothetical protein
MSYQIMPIEFEGASPSINQIKKGLSDYCEEVIVLEAEELIDQYQVYFECKPDEKLNFDIKSSTATISGDAGSAPALCSVLYAVLIKLDGKPLPNIEPIPLPLTREAIESINSTTRKELKKYGVIGCSYIAILFIFFVLVIGLLLFWLL